MGPYVVRGQDVRNDDVHGWTVCLERTGVRRDGLQDALYVVRGHDYMDVGVRAKQEVRTEEVRNDDVHYYLVADLQLSARSGS